MAQTSRENCECQVRKTLHELQTQSGLPFQHLLEGSKVQTALKEAQVEFRDRIYTPYVTLWAFLSQVSMGQVSACQDAVSRVSADRVAKGLKACSPDTNSYCQARLRLPLSVLQSLTTSVGQELHNEAPPEWLWHGRPVKVLDGSTATMTDTAENQNEFPQSSSQQPGLGFPILRFLACLSLGGGTVLACAVSACQGKRTGEQSLFLEIADVIETNDIVLGDCLFDSYQIISSCVARQADVVFGMNQSRDCDFRRGRRLGHDDHVVTWQRPKYDSNRFGSRSEWEQLPESLEMREIKVTIRRRGYRTHVVMLVTSLLDAEAYSTEDISDLLAERWHCELDFRSIKQTLGMYHLRCKTPDMVRKELWAYLLSYNLVRCRMAQAAVGAKVLPRRLSFTAARNHIHNYALLLSTASAATFARLEIALITAIGGEVLLSRPGRKEPRAIKKRKTKYPYLTEPRTKARKRLTA